LINKRKMEKQLAEAAYHTERKNDVIAVGTTV
jgi:hypothetical protein